MVAISEGQCVGQAGKIPHTGKWRGGSNFHPALMPETATFLDKVAGRQKILHIHI